MTATTSSRYGAIPLPHKAWDAVPTITPGWAWTGQLSAAALDTEQGSNGAHTLWAQYGTVALPGTGLTVTLIATGRSPTEQILDRLDPQQAHTWGIGLGHRHLTQQWAHTPTQILGSKQTRAWASDAARILRTTPDLHRAGPLEPPTIWALTLGGLTPTIY